MKSRNSIFILFLILLLSDFSRAQSFFYHLLPQNNIPPFAWTGLAGDNNWNSSGNWSTNTVPGASDVAKFYGSACSGGNCNANINVNINVAGIEIDSAYGGTITQNATRTITLGSSGWSQAGGTFMGGNSNIMAGGTFAQSGGIFNSTTATLEIMYGMNRTAGSFVHNSGTVQFSAYNSATITTAGASFFNMAWHGLAGGGGPVLTLTDGFSILGNLSCDLVGYNNMAVTPSGLITILLYGNLSVAKTHPAGDVWPAFGNNSLTLSLVGSVDQILTRTGASFGAAISLNKPSGIAKLASDFYFDGDLIIPAGQTFDVSPDAGTTVFNPYFGTGLTNDGTFLPRTSTVSFLGMASGSVKTGGVSFANLSFLGKKDNGAPTTTLLDNFTVTGQLLFDLVGYNNYSVLPSGSRTITLLGDLTLQKTQASGGVNGTFGNSSLTLNFAGTGNQYINQSGSAFRGPIIENKATGSIILNTATSLPAAGQDLTINNGTTDMNGNNLSVNDVLTVSSTGVLLCHGGTLSYGSLINNGIVDCMGVGYSWTGLAGDGNWNTPGNWSGNAVPGASHIAVFGSLCVGAACHVTVNTNVSVKGVAILNVYTGTITQAATRTITVGANGWTQAGGTFIGGNSAVTMNASHLNISAGSYAATSGWTTVDNLIISGAATFAHNSGSFQFNSGGGTINISGKNLNHVSITGSWTNRVYSIVGLMNVDGNLTMDCTNCTNANISGGTVSAKGNVTAANWQGGTALLKISGSSSQNIAGALPSVEIASTGGTVTFANSSINHNFTYTSGTVSMAGATLTFTSSMSTAETINSGSLHFNNVNLANAWSNMDLTIVGTMYVDGNLYLDCNNCTSYSVNGGTISLKGNLSTGSWRAGSATIKMAGTANQSITGGGLPNVEIASTGGLLTFTGTTSIVGNFTYTSGVVSAAGSTVNFVGSAKTINSGSMHFGNLSFASSWVNMSHTITGTVYADGTLTLDCVSCGSFRIDGGEIQVGGNVNSLNWQGGTTAITMVNASNQTVTGGIQQSGTITVNKTSGNVTLASNQSYSSAGQDLSITSGTLDMNGKNLSVNDVLTVGSTGTLLCNGGTLTYGSLVNNGTVDCPGVGYRWTGLAGDNNWNTPGNWSGNAVPGAAHVAIFSTGCVGAACNATINVAANVKGISILSGYTGTLTQSAGQSITVGTTGWTQSGGTFIGGNSAITLSGSFSLSGGTFTSTSNLLTTPGNFSVSGSAIFNDGSGSVAFSTSGTVVPGSAVFNHVAFGGCSTVFTINGSMIINGNLTAGAGCGAGTMNGGILEAKGDITFNFSGFMGTTLIKVSGAGNQTVSGTASARIPAFEIASTGGVVSFSSTLLFFKDYIYTSGTVNVGTSTVIFDGNGNVTPGAFPYNNITIVGCSAVYTLTGNLTVNGTLTLGAGCGAGIMNGGTLIAKGDVVFNNSGYSGTVSIQIAGAGNQTITGTAFAQIPNFEIVSTGGVVTLVDSLNFMKNFTYTSGSVNAGTGTVIFGGSATVTPGPIFFNHVTFKGCSTVFNINGTVNINGVLTAGAGCGTGTMNNGTLAAKGDVVFNNSGFVGTTLIRVSGSGNQTISGTTFSTIPFFEIASTGGTVTLDSSLLFFRDFTYVSGTVNAGTSTAIFGNSLTATPGSIAFNNVTFSGCYSTFVINGTLTTNGTLTLNDPCGTGYLNTGTILAKGNVVFGTNGYTGSAALTIGGASDTTLTFAVTSLRMTGPVTVNKSVATAKLTLLAASSFNSVGQDLTITSGILDMSGYNLTVNDILTVGVSGTLICNGGTYTSTSLVMDGTIDCAGYAFNWKGGSGTNWNTAANWTGGVVPNNTKIAIFSDAYCGANCNATVTADPNVKGVRLLGGYSGAITQASAMTIGTSGWIQAGGTFSGATQAINFSGDFNLQGGSFVSTSGVFTQAASNFTQTGGVFTANSGAVKFNGSAPNISTSSMAFNDLQIVNNGNSFLTGTISVGGTLTIGAAGAVSSVYTGTIAAAGNVDFINPGGGTATIKLAGSGNQSVTQSAGYTPSIEIASTGGTVSLPVGTLTLAGSFKHTSGAVSVSPTIVINASGANISSVGMNFNNLQFIGSGNTFLTGTIIVDGTLTVGSVTNINSIYSGTIEANGNVDFINPGGGTAWIKLAGSGNQSVTQAAGYTPSIEIASTGGTVSLPVGTLTLAGSFKHTSGAVSVSPTIVINASGASISSVGMNFNNLQFIGAGNTFLTGTIIVDGTLTVGSVTNTNSIFTGTIQANGNVDFVNPGGGTASINYAGTNNQTITVFAGTPPAGSTTINKAAGTVTLASNTNFNSFGQDLTITAGTLDMAGYNLTIGRHITNSGTLKRGNNPACGTVSQGGTYSGNAAICP